MNIYIYIHSALETVMLCQGNVTCCTLMQYCLKS